MGSQQRHRLQWPLSRFVQQLDKLTNAELAQKLNAHCGYNRGSGTKEQAKKRDAEDTEHGAHWRQRKKSQAKPPPSPSCRYKFDLYLTARTSYHTDGRKSINHLTFRRLMSTIVDVPHR